MVQKRGDEGVKLGDDKVIINTVRGPVRPDDLGITLPHEHVIVDLRKRFLWPTSPDEFDAASSPVTMSALGWIRFNQEKCLDNLHLSDPETAILELLPFKLAGGGTVVDLTTKDMGRNPEGLVHIAEVTGLNIVMATGMYLQAFHQPEVENLSVEGLAESLVSDIRQGVGPRQIRAGIIGEMGCSWPLAPTERKALAAAALAQQQTGAAISIHPGRHPDAPTEILDLMLAGGVELDRVIICHIERTFASVDPVLKLLARGVNIELDYFGQESSHIKLSGNNQESVEMPSDLDRIRTLVACEESGYGNQLLLSHDIALKHNTVTYGGHGYGHLLRNVVARAPELNLPMATFQKWMVENPKRLLSLPANQIQ